MTFRLIIAFLFVASFAGRPLRASNVLASNLTVQNGVWLQGDISPAEITADQNDYNPTGLATAMGLRISSDASHTITGLVPGASPDGRMLIVYSIDNGVVLKNESTSSTAANRFHLGADVTLTGGGAGALLQYDSTSSRWRMIGGAAADGGSPGEGTVTSVGVTVPAGFAVSGSPVTASGTIAITFATGQTAYRVLATDTTASALALRALSLAYISDAGTMAAASTSNYYTKSATDTLLGDYVPVTRTVNGHALSGDVTVTKIDLSLGNVENTALSTWAGSTALTTVGTIATGVWQGMAIANAYLAHSVVTIGSSSLSLGGTLTSLQGVKLGSLTGNGFVKTSGSDGTLGIDTASYLDATTAESIYLQMTDAASTYLSIADAGTTYLSIADAITSYQPLDTGLTALAGASSDGFYARTGTDTWSPRSIEGTLDRISVAVGNGSTGNPVIDIDSAYVGQSTITTLGTVTTGTWYATAIAANKGGTGQTAYTTGDLLYASSSSALSKLAAVASGQVLVSAGTGTAPAWSDTPQLSRIGLGLAADANLTAVMNSSTTAAVSSASVRLQGASNTERIEVRSAAGNPGFQGVGFGGSIASPTRTLSGVLLAFMGGAGVDNAGTPAFTGNKGLIAMQATEDWTTTAQGNEITFQVTPNGSTTRNVIGTVDSTGLSVTGTISATGTGQFTRLGVGTSAGSTDGITIAGVTTPTIALDTTSSVGGISRLWALNNGSVYLSRNLSYDGTNFNLDVIGSGGAVVNLASDGGLRGRYTAAGSNPRTLTDMFLFSSTGLAVTGGVSATGSLASTTNGRVDLSGSANPYVSFNDGTATSYLEVISHDLDAYVGGANNFTVRTNGTLRATINSSGLTVGGAIGAGAAAANASNGAVWAISGTGNYSMRLGVNGTGSQNFVNFVIGENGTPIGVGSVTTNGTVTAYNTSSDVRLKTNIRPLPDSGKIIDALRPVLFDWKSQQSPNTYGFIAQEVYKVFPQAVTKGDDGQTISQQWAMDASKFMPVVVSELQSLRARVAKLESR